MNPKIKPGINLPTKLKLQNGLITSKVKTNHTDVLSKAGLSNVNTGTREVLRNQFKAPVNPILENYEGNKMTVTLPIKKIILEEGLTEHIQRNANKYAGGAILGAGLAVGNALGDGDLVSNAKSAFSDGPTSNPGSESPAPVKMTTQEDHFKNDLNVNSGVTTHTRVESNPGIFGALKAGFNHTGDTIRTANKHDDLVTAQNDYNDIKNGEGSLLTTGQMVGTTAGLGTAGYLASKMRRRSGR